MKTRKMISLILALTLALGIGCACAEQNSFLVSDWMLLYTAGDNAIDEQPIFLYEDNTFEMMGESESQKGTWTFDGETLVLTGGDETLSLKWNEAEHEFRGELGGMTVTMFMSIEPEAETRTFRLGTSVYTVEIPAHFTEGERTEAEIRDDMVAYMRSDETLLDFDVYQFPKEGLPEKLDEYAEQEAAEYHAFEVKTGTNVNGIDAAWYRAKETYNGREYTTLNYLFDDGVQYVEICFWLDGDTAEEEAQAIISTLTFIQR